MHDYVIDRWLDRGTRFFRAVTKNSVVRGVLLARGLTDAELGHGWELYSRVFGISQSGERAVPELDTSAADAMNEIDEWDAPTYQAIGRVLAQRYPAVGTYLFDGLSAGEGPAAVTGVGHFLERVGRLKEGRAENIEPEVGRAAVALLSERKLFTDADAGHLRSLIEVTQRGADAAPPPPAKDPADDAALDAYIKWITEWREVARYAIKRRDHRISLGLAHRKVSAGETDDDGEDDDELP
jgi:hypothetical protein